MRNVKGLAAGALTGLLVGAAWVISGFELPFLVGVLVGLVAALIYHRTQVAAWTASIRREDSDRWLRDLPRSLSALRRPLKAVVARIEAREQALANSVGREQLRDLEIDALRERVDTLESNLDDARSDLLRVLDTAGGVVDTGDGASHIGDVRLMAGLGLLAEGPSTPVPLGDVIAEAVEARPGLRGRVVVEEALPTVHGPRPLIELLVERLISACDPQVPDRVVVGGRTDGGLAVLQLAVVGDGFPVDVDPVVARAAATLGGEAWIGRRGKLMVAVPCRYQPGLRAVSRPAIDWDFPEAI